MLGEEWQFEGPKWPGVKQDSLWKPNQTNGNLCIYEREMRNRESVCKGWKDKGKGNLGIIWTSRPESEPVHKIFSFAYTT